jgi:hypothetical protein
MKKKGETAEELLARLEADPEFVADRSAREIAHLEREAVLRAAEAPVVAELRAAGYPVESVWDLVNTSSNYAEALPILVGHLSKPYPDAVRDGIARALAVPEANFAIDTLKRLYQAEKKGRAKDGLAVALAAVAQQRDEAEIIRLARDTKNGSSRLLLLRALARFADAKARATLMELGSDPELYKEAQLILRRLKRRDRSSGKPNR